MFPILLKIGPVTLHTYGLLVALGFLAGYWLSHKEFERQGLAPDYIDRIGLVLMLSAILGARLFYYVLSGKIGTFGSAPLEFFKIWEGGLVFYGGFAGALAFIVIYTRLREIPFLAFTDALAAPLLIGQAIGRLGCFAAGCCYGRPTSSFLGVTFTSAESLAPTHIPLHPTQLYSAAGDLFLLYGLFLLRRRRPEQGFGTSYYLVGYGIGRFLIEYVRYDDRGPVWAGLTPSQLLSIVAIMMGVALYRYVQKERPA